MTPESYQGPPSFTKALFLGEVHPGAVFPFPALPEGEQERVDALVEAGQDFLAETYDAREAEAQGRIDDRIFQGLGEIGLLGLYLPQAYGGQGGYPRRLTARYSSNSPRLIPPCPL